MQTTSRGSSRTSTANAEKPVVVGHSMGGLNVLAFARLHPQSARGVMAIDIAVTSSRGRDRYLRRLKATPGGHVSGSRNGEGALSIDAE